MRKSVCLMEIGESRMQNCGQVATITEYINSKNITVRFEDGTIVTGSQYGNFKKGAIRNPNAFCRKYNVANHSQRIGESRMQNCGQVATITEYVNSQNITVRFEDGTIVTRRTYDSFKKGAIRNPKNRIGESREQRCGQVATITDYKNYSNISVRFEDGTIVTGKRYGNFLKGDIGNPNAVGSKAYAVTNIKKRIGESQMQKCGQVATITEYINSQNITVRFEDGTIVTRREYDSFKKGAIRNPKNRIGESQLQRCGQVATITEYKNFNNITVRFEDGTIVTRRAYDSFKKGGIGNPNAIGSKAYAKANIAKRIGESQPQKCGQVATITQYKNASNISVRFEDGTIVTGRTYLCFKRGHIGNPNAVGSAAYTLANIAQRIGESQLQNCGQIATITEYIKSQNITVRFEDGTIVTRRAYDSFKKGAIRNPNASGSKVYTKAQRIGESQMQKCGQVATITEYINSQNITVRFEDGTIVTGSQYGNFKRGEIRNKNQKK